MVLLALGVASCDHARDPIAPSQSQEQVGEPQELLGILDPVLNPSRTVQAVDQNGRVGTYELIQEPVLNLDLTNLRISKLIGIQGGTLTLLGHRIVVPRGAVDAPALFTLIVLPSGYVQVDISALAGDLLSLINVGEQGFDVPVRLDLTYERATNVERPRDLVILRLNPRGIGYLHEALPTSVDRRNERATVWLDHFSGYCMAQ
jgi:hypothetical protein